MYSEILLILVAMAGLFIPLLLAWGILSWQERATAQHRRARK